IARTHHETNPPACLRAHTDDSASVASALREVPLRAAVAVIGGGSPVARCSSTRRPPARQPRSTGFAVGRASKRGPRSRSLGRSRESLGRTLVRRSLLPGAEAGSGIKQTGLPL